MYFIKAIGAFSPVTVRGLIYIYARGFITITRVLHPLQYCLKLIKRHRIRSLDEAGLYSEHSLVNSLHLRITGTQRVHSAVTA